MSYVRTGFRAAYSLDPGAGHLRAQCASVLKLMSRITQWTMKDSSHAGVARQAAGAPDLDRFRQMGFQLPGGSWLHARSLGQTSLQNSRQHLERSLGNKVLPQMCAYLRQPAPAPSPHLGLGLGPWSLRCLLEIMDGKVFFKIDH